MRKKTAWLLRDLPWPSRSTSLYLSLPKGPHWQAWQVPLNRPEITISWEYGNELHKTDFYTYGSFNTRHSTLPSIMKEKLRSKNIICSQNPQFFVHALYWVFSGGHDQAITFEVVGKYVDSISQGSLSREALARLILSAVSTWEVFPLCEALIAKPHQSQNMLRITSHTQQD